VSFDAVGEGHLGAGVAGVGGAEFGAEGGEGSAASGCAGRVEADVQGAVGDLQVAGQGERFAEQRAGFVAAAGVGERDKLGEVTRPASVGRARG